METAMFTTLFVHGKTEHFSNMQAGKYASIFLLSDTPLLILVLIILVLILILDNTILCR